MGLVNLVGTRPSSAQAQEDRVASGIVLHLMFIGDVAKLVFSGEAGALYCCRCQGRKGDGSNVEAGEAFCAHPPFSCCFRVEPGIPLLQSVVVLVMSKASNRYLNRLLHDVDDAEEGHCKSQMDRSKPTSQRSVKHLVLLRLIIACGPGLHGGVRPRLSKNWQ